MPHHADDDEEVAEEGRHDDEPHDRRLEGQEEHGVCRLQEHRGGGIGGVLPALGARRPF